MNDAVNLVFMALVVWREARGEKEDCRIGVAYSILNRMKRVSWWNNNTINDVLSAVSKPWQYSSMTDPKDRQLTRWPISNDPSWQSCLRIAQGVLKGEIPNPVAGSDSYYDVSIPAPKWATREQFVVQIGKVRFYNLDND